MTTTTCSNCNTERPAANLTVLPNGEVWCPEDLAAAAQRAYEHQTLAEHRPRSAAEAGRPLTMNAARRSPRSMTRRVTPVSTKGELL